MGELMYATESVSPVWALLFPFIPVLIFGVSAADANFLGIDSQPQFVFLGSLFLGSLAICPWVVSISVRHALN